MGDKRFNLETVEGVRAAQQWLRKLVMPWDTDGSHPPKATRRNGLGQVIAVADPHLGGYSSRNTRERGLVGVASGGQGTPIDNPSLHDVVTGTDDGKRRIDAFLRKDHPELVFLEDIEANDGPQVDAADVADMITTELNAVASRVRSQLLGCE